VVSQTLGFLASGRPPRVPASLTLDPIGIKR
jgi:hypothetical protein